jgi:uncharacterized membrane protein YfcA
LAYPPTVLGASARNRGDLGLLVRLLGVGTLGRTAAFLAVGWNYFGKPANALGDVALFCVAALSLPALFVAPFVACWSARVPVVLLRRLFASCLALIAARLLTML